MFDYTIAAVHKTIDDIKSFVFACGIGTNSLYVIYLIYAIFAPAGNLYVNILLGIASVAYLFIYIYTHEKNSKRSKRIKSMSAHTLRCFKIIMKAFTLSVTVYGIYAASTHITVISVFMAAITAVGWLLQVLFEFINYFIESRVNLIMAGLEADVENIKRPFETFGNIFKKVSGKESEPETSKQPSKQRILLDKKVSETRAEKQKIKEERRRKILQKFTIKKTIDQKTEPEKLESTSVDIPSTTEREEETV